MKILFAVIADDLIRLKNERFDARGVQPTLFIDEEALPEERQLVLCLGTRADREDTFQEVDLSIIWVNETTDWSVLMVVPIKFPPEIDGPGGIIKMPLGLTFESAGRHRFEILIEGEKVAEVALEVVVIPKEV